MLRLRTTVPEAPIHENNYALTIKNKIRLAEQSLSSPPTGNPMRSEKRHRAQLRILVSAAADARHHGTALLDTENICHHA